jgi:glucose repression regulatory protein TUP1
LVIDPRYRSLGLNVELLHTLDHSSVVCCVRFSRCGKFLATGCNHLAQIYDLSGRKLMYH